MLYLLWYSAALRLNGGHDTNLTVHFFSHEKTNQKSDRLRILYPALVFGWDNSNGPFSYKIDLLEITGIELSLSASTNAQNPLYRTVESH